MPGTAKSLRANKSATTLLVLFIPSHDRYERRIEQKQWVDEALTTLGTLFGGATAYPQGRGVWRDDARQGKLVFDEPVVMQCYTSEQAIQKEAKKLREFLVRLGTETGQGAVGLVIDDQYLEIRFPLKD